MTHSLGLSYSALCIALCACSSFVMADTTTNTTTPPTQTLETLTFGAQAEPKADPDISAVAKTVISREEMLQYGDQSVNDALRRAAGFQMPTPPGQGPRGAGGAGAMRFRGGSAPVFLINGEPVQGGPRGGMSIVDTLTPEMIERIEIVKQPSVAQASVASSAMINIILKQPLDNTRINGSVRLGYGFAESDSREEERKNLSLQADGRTNQWTYSLSANQSIDETQTVSNTQNAGESVVQQKRVNERKSLMLTPRAEYEIDDQQKIVAEIFYREHQNKGSNGSTLQSDENESIRFNTRYERKDGGNSDKIRLSLEQQDEIEITRSNRGTENIQEEVNEYGLAYDGVRKFNAKQQIKFGVDLKNNELDSNQNQTLEEQRYAAYLEGSWRFTDRQTVTLGARQEWLERSGLVDYSDSHLSPVLAHRFDFNNQWSLQTNLSQAFRSPNSNSLLPTISYSTDADAGSLNNPDRGGNPFLKPEQINAFESTLGYNTAAGGINLTGYYREVDDYIERVVNLEGDRYVQRPTNQNSATTYGVELSGRYAIKQTEAGHSFMVNAQVSTVRAKIDLDNGGERLASGVAPYSASAGVSYNYQPWQLATSMNLSYTPAFTRPVDNQPYVQNSNERVNVDISATKRFQDGWSTSLSARNILSTDYKTRLYKNNGEFYQARTNEAIPSVLLSVEKKF
jgi:outer membrane receptor for ferrienterochelin and colicins